MSKKSIIYLCDNCGADYAAWQGKCGSCGEWNTIVEQKIADTVTQGIRLVMGEPGSGLKPLTLENIYLKEVRRIPSGMPELDRVLGKEQDSTSGLVPGSVLLITGEPGVGKSTLLLQLGKNLGSTADVVYISAEESLTQIASRAKRLRLAGDSRMKYINLYDLDGIISLLVDIAPQKKGEQKVVFLDSIQTIYSNEVRGVPGGLAQIRYCAAKLVSLSKQLGITLIIVGHITKEGNIAGPKVLEHLVDVVLTFSGEENSSLRSLRAPKNRFGSTDEVGLFLMEESGLIDLSDPGDYFLESGGGKQTESQVGVCRTIVMEGLRPLVVEVQALVVSTNYSLAKRVSEGFSLSRLNLLTAVLGKYLKLNLQNHDIYLNIAKGFNIKDRGADLAVLMAIYSSLKAKPLLRNNIYCAELNLSGNLSAVSFMKKRKSEAKRLGYIMTSSQEYTHVSQLGNTIL